MLAAWRAAAGTYPQYMRVLAKTRASRDDTMRRAYESVEMPLIDSRQIYCLA